MSHTALTRVLGPVHMTVEIIKETDDEIYVHDARVTAWLPRNAVQVEPEKSAPPSVVRITLDKWLAAERGLL